jgi:2-polyprenyl-3-methyl-5-hydroxy-6-metoxy-1,4-benzoquinol methylase
MWLRKREYRAELLDDPGLDQTEAQKALEGLRRLNFVSRSAGILWTEIHKLVKAENLQQLRVFDVASGGGDTLRALLRKARRRGLALTIGAGDINPSSLTYAKNRALNCGEQIEFFPHDALDDPLPAGYDVMMCSLFLHHLTELLGRMARAANRLMLVNDLRRSLGNYLLVWLGSRLLSRSRIVHTDGPLSVKNAFTVAELAALAKKAGLENFVISMHFPARMLLICKKS